MAVVAIQERLEFWKSVLALGWEAGWQNLESRFKLDRDKRRSWVRVGAKCAAVAAGAALGATAFLYRFKPEVIVQSIINWNRRKAGFVTKTVKDALGFTFSYGERGQQRPNQPVIILLPGLTGSIDNWVPVAKFMEDHFMIAVEMPGGGKTSCNPQTDLCIMGQVQRLRQLLALLKLNGRKLHLVGAATGGTVVGCYAAMYPDNVAKLTLICPALRSAQTADVISTELAGVDSGMLFKSPETIAKSLELLSKKPRKLNKQMATGLYRIKRQNMLDGRKLADSMLDDIWRGEKDTLLVPRLKNIKAPTQVIWGQYDRVIHVSGVEVLKQGLTNCQSVDVLDQCGHSIYMDEPEKLADLLEDFIAKR